MHLRHPVRFNVKNFLSILTCNGDGDNISGDGVGMGTLLMGMGWGWVQDAWGWGGDGDNVTGMGWGWGCKFIPVSIFSLHPQSVAEISRHSVLSGDKTRQCGTSSGSRYKDTDQCL